MHRQPGNLVSSLFIHHLKQRTAGSVESSLNLNPSWKLVFNCHCRLFHNIMILPYTFGILWGLGLWHMENNSGWRIFFQVIHCYVVIFIVYAEVLFESIALFGTFNDLEQFVGSSIIYLTMIGVCGKMANIVIKRKEILNLINILKADPCWYRSAEEKNIQDKFDKTIK